MLNRTDKIKARITELNVRLRSELASILSKELFSELRKLYREYESLCEKQQNKLNKKLLKALRECDNAKKAKKNQKSRRKLECELLKKDKELQVLRDKNSKMQEDILSLREGLSYFRGLNDEKDSFEVLTVEQQYSYELSKLKERLEVSPDSFSDSEIACLREYISGVERAQEEQNMRAKFGFIRDKKSGQNVLVGRVFPKNMPFEKLLEGLKNHIYNQGKKRNLKFEDKNSVFNMKGYTRSLLEKNRGEGNFIKIYQGDSTDLLGKLYGLCSNNYEFYELEKLFITYVYYSWGNEYSLNQDKSYKDRSDKLYNLINVDEVFKSLSDSKHKHSIGYRTDNSRLQGRHNERVRIYLSKVAKLVEVGLLIKDDTRGEYDYIINPAFYSYCNRWDMYEYYKGIKRKSPSQRKVFEILRSVVIVKHKKEHSFFRADELDSLLPSKGRLNGEVVLVKGYTHYEKRDVAPFVKIYNNYLENVLFVREGENTRGSNIKKRPSWYYSSRRRIYILEVLLLLRSLNNNTNSAVVNLSEFQGSVGVNMTTSEFNKFIRRLEEVKILQIDRFSNPSGRVRSNLVHLFFNPYVICNCSDESRKRRNLINPFIFSAPVPFRSSGVNLGCNFRGVYFEVNMRALERAIMEFLSFQSLRGVSRQLFNILMGKHILVGIIESFGRDAGWELARGSKCPVVRATSNLLYKDFYGDKQVA